MKNVAPARFCLSSSSSSSSSFSKKTRTIEDENDYDCRWDACPYRFPDTRFIFAKLTSDLLPLGMKQAL